MTSKINGIKRAGCDNPECEACALGRARARFYGGSNIFVAVTARELAIIEKTRGLVALGERVRRAVKACVSYRRPEL